MAQAAFTFPRSFKWGTATAAYQVEGHNTNSEWWAWEQTPGKIRDGHRSGAACDWWAGRWREDFDRAAEAGQNAHRLSVEWSRLEPRPDAWDEAALDHYRQMLRGLRERGMEPMVTLHHFSNPLWLAEMGGWLNESAVTHFARFAQKAVAALGDLCDLWCTINEPNVYAYSAYPAGEHPPGRGTVKDFFRVTRHQIRAHAAAYHAIHAVQPNARVGIVIHYRNFGPARPGFPPDAWVAKLHSNLSNDVIVRSLHDGRLRWPVGRETIPSVAGTMDFLGINYYSGYDATFDLRQAGNLFGRWGFRDGATLSDEGFMALRPEGMFEAVRWGQRFGVPIYITENGVNDRSDWLRPTYLLTYLRQLWRTVNFNWPVKGYFHWTLVDNFEWAAGWSRPFGLWALDLETQVRTPRPSARLYAEICKSGQLTSDMVERYAPQLAAQMFPG